jgi:YidC/Oxa1 family membrane protein insertase
VASANVDVLRNSTDVREIIGGLRLNGASVDVAAKSITAMPLAVFFGPKKADLLKGDVHGAAGTEALARNIYGYNKLIQFNQSGCFLYSACTFDFLGDLLVWMLNHLRDYVTFGNYGLAIILLVIIIRALLHPLTRASQVNMATMGKKMKDIQPLIEANKKKYAKDKTKLNEEMMRIYKEHNVNPAGGLMGCLPMVIQMPIWIAMWSALRTDIDLRHAVFIPGWINDLSAPDMTWIFAAPIHVPFVGWEITALNILPLLLGIVFFLQMKVQTASQPKPADDQQAQMQKMSQYMVLIVPLFLYSQPSGLNLYYFASTLGGLVDTYFVRKTLKRKGILPASAQSLPTHEDKDEKD